VSERDQIIDVESIEDDPNGTVASLAPIVRGDALVRPAASVADVESAFHDYQRLCQRLLDDDDIQQIGGKSFRKKSAWRKLAVAFGVSCEVRDRDYERDEQGRIVRAEIVVRAMAPNGRYMDGLGVCDISERKFSKPNHDIPATAMTRATNRACADLFGMGEVSAEEITDDGSISHRMSDASTRSPRARDIRQSNVQPEWKMLGYDSDATYRDEMSALIAAVKAMPEDARASYKNRRKTAGIAWPVPFAQMTDAWSIVADLADTLEDPADEEPF
jgi:hypothetical protein